MENLVDDIIRTLSELAEKGYVTPGDILEATNPILAGFEPIPEDYDWPKMPENWIDTI